RAAQLVWHWLGSSYSNATDLSTYHHDSAHRLPEAITGTVQEVRGVQLRTQAVRHRAIDSRTRRPAGIAAQRLRVLRRHARQGSHHAWRATAPIASHRHLARIDTLQPA